MAARRTGLELKSSGGERAVHNDRGAFSKGWQGAAAYVSFMALADSLAAGAAILTRDGSALYVNPALSTLTGRPRTELLGAGVAALVAEDDGSDSLGRALRHAAEGHALELAVDLQRKGGGRVPARLALLSVPGEEPAANHVLLTVTDLSERHFAENLLRAALHTATALDTAASDRALRSVAAGLEAQMPGCRCVVVVDSGSQRLIVAPTLAVASSAALGNVLLAVADGRRHAIDGDERWAADPTACRTAEREGLTGCWSTPVELPDGARAVLALVGEAPAAPRARDRDLVALAAIGVRLAMVHGSARPAAEPLREVVEALPLGVLVVDEAGGRTVANHTFRSLWRCPPDLAGEVGAIQAHIAAQLEQPAAYSAQAVRARRTRVPLSSLLALRDGRLIHEQCQPLVREGGNVGFVASYQEVDDNACDVGVERAMARLQAAAISAGGAVHDINNLLAGLLGHVELLRLNLGDHPSQAELLDDLSHVAQLAAELARQVLYAGRGETPPKTRVDLNVLVHRALAPLQHGVPQDVDLQLRLTDPLWPLEATPVQVVQVVQNLVRNAIEAMADSGHVRVETRNLRLEADTAAHCGVPPGAWVALLVADTGPGIGAELRRIFAPFFTTKAGGHGIGLAAVCSIVQAHGGTMLVDPAPGRGATFAALLPAVDAAVGEAGEPLPETLQPVGDWAAG